MLALFAIIVLIPLLYLPGYLIALALLGAAQPTDTLERHYERVIVGALLNGWLALLLAELSIFSAWLHLLLLALTSGVAALVALRRGVWRWPRFTRFQLPTRVWLGVQWEVLSFLAIGIVFVVLVARPFEVVLGARDAGVYTNTGFAIAKTGGIVQHDALIQEIGADQQSPDPNLQAAAAQAETNFLSSQPASRFMATRLRLSGFLIWAGDLNAGRVVPQFLHLYPAWIGLFTGLFGLHGGLLSTGLLGFLGVWGVGMLGRRLAGTWVGLLGALLLALNGVQVWFSRYSTSEACAQFLCFTALYFFSVLQDAMQAPDTHPNAKSHTWFAGLFAGIAGGQMALTRIDFFVIVVPLLLYLVYMALTKRWNTAIWALAGGLGAMLFHTLLHIIFISRAYFLDTLYARLQDTSAMLAYAVYYLWTPALQAQFMSIPRSLPLRQPWRLPLEIAIVILLLVAFMLIRHDGRLQRWFEQFVLRYQHGLLRLGAIAIVLLGVYGYIIRPQILTWPVLAAVPSCLAPAQLRAPSGACLALQGYIGAPIALPAHPNQVAYALTALPKWVQGKSVPVRAESSFSPNAPNESGKIAIAQANLVRLGWYLSPLGVVLGVLGCALWWRRGLNRAAWPFLTASLMSAIFFIRLAYGATDLTYIYILRRFVPMVYPAFSLAIAYALVAFARWSVAHVGQRLVWLGRGPALLCALALIGFLLITNRPLYTHVEYGGALNQLTAIVERYGFSSRDVLLFRGEGRDTPDLVVTPLKYAFGIDALAIRSTDPGAYARQLSDYIQHWQAEGRNVYLVLGPNGAVPLPGLQATRIGPVSLHLAEFQQLRDQKPRGVQQFAFDFEVYQLTADAASVATAAPPLAIDDYAAQVSGFYHPEQIAGVPLVWTDGNAQLRLPAPIGKAAHTLTLKLSPGASRPISLGPAQVCISYRVEQSFKLEDLPFSVPQCITLTNAQMNRYQFTIDLSDHPPAATGTYLLRIVSTPWVPAKVDPTQVDQRSLGVQFGGLQVEP